MSAAPQLYARSMSRFGVFSGRGLADHTFNNKLELKSVAETIYDGKETVKDMGGREVAETLRELESGYESRQSAPSLYLNRMQGA